MSSTSQFVTDSYNKYLHKCQIQHRTMRQKCFVVSVTREMLPYKETAQLQKHWVEGYVMNMISWPKTALINSFSIPRLDLME